MTGETAKQKADSDSRERRLLRVALKALIALLVLGGLYKVVSLQFGGDTELTMVELEVASQNWEKQGQDSYDLEVVFKAHGLERLIRLEVRNNEVSSGTSDGRKMTQEEANRWTIPSQFERIRKDVIASQAGSSQLNIRENSELIPKAKFDDKLGYPLQFRYSGEGTPLQYSWKVTEFEIVQ